MRTLDLLSCKTFSKRHYIRIKFLTFEYRRQKCFEVLEVIVDVGRSTCFHASTMYDVRCSKLYYVHNILTLCIKLCQVAAIEFRLSVPIARAQYLIQT